ncbi:MAG: TMEM165/GDT1 family protein [Candidatus Micrarchaeia archaeon]
MFDSFFAAFLLVAVTEFGDKTQFMILLLASGGRAFSVLSGALLAFLVVDGLAVVFGAFVYSVVPLYLLKFFAGLLFLAFGLWTLLHYASEARSSFSKNASFFSSFVLVASSEFGDKSQVAVALLAAQSGDLFQVLFGALSALFILSALAVFAGYKFLKLVPHGIVRLSSGVLFMLFGFLTFASLFFQS